MRRHLARRSGLLAGALCAVLALAAAMPAAAQPTRAGTRIISVVQVQYVTDEGEQQSVSSDSLVMIVGQVAGIAISPPRAAAVAPGSDALIAYEVQNAGNGVDSIAVAATSSGGWRTRVYLDRNQSGAVDEGDVLVTGALALEPGEAAAILILVQVPPETPPSEHAGLVTITAGSAFDPATASTRRDTIEVGSGGIVARLDKAVNRATASVGDVLTYTIDYAIGGLGRGTDFHIVDAVPAGTVYVRGSLHLDGVALPDGDPTGRGFFDAAANRLVVRIGDVAAGDAGRVTFQVRVER